MGNRGYNTPSVYDQVGLRIRGEAPEGAFLVRAVRPVTKVQAIRTHCAGGGHVPEELSLAEGRAAWGRCSSCQQFVELDWSERTTDPRARNVLQPYRQQPVCMEHTRGLKLLEIHSELERVLTSTEFPCPSCMHPITVHGRHYANDEWFVAGEHPHALTGGQMAILSGRYQERRALRLLLLPLTLR